MTATYSYDPSVSGPLAPLYNVRTLIGDTDVAGMAAGLPAAQQTALFSDQQILSFLALNNGDLVFAAYDALMAVAARYSVMAVRVDMGGGAVGNVDFTSVADKLRAQAEQMRLKYMETPAESFSAQDVGGFSALAILQNAIMSGQTP